MNRHAFRIGVLAVLLVVPDAKSADHWVRHTIDDGSRGADGVRLGDVNKDGRLDIVTGWEEGGEIRICLQPQESAVRGRWPVTVIAKVKSPEDAVFVDVNADGWLDVVSSCEGNEQAIYFHVNPGNSRVTDGQAWRTVPVEAAAGRTRWMFCEPLRVANSSGRMSLIAGSKNPAGQIAHLSSEGDAEARLVEIRRAGWIMSLRGFDVDHDGDQDLIYSDRKGSTRGVGWLEALPAVPNTATDWVDHEISRVDAEYMFLDVADSDDGRPVVACQTRADGIFLFRPGDDVTNTWQELRIAAHPSTGNGKGIAMGDIDLDGRLDLVGSCEHAGGRIGVYWLQFNGSQWFDAEIPSGTADPWRTHDISGTEAGTKFDRIELLDLDQDGDLDLLTCEERDNLGVIWYENPTNN
jgi:hypothetical protein